MSLKRQKKPNGGQVGNTNRRFGWGESSKRSLLASYKQSARYREHPWGLSDEEFFDIVVRDCYYCGTPASQEHLRNKDSFGAFRYSGIDRVDSTLGYWPDNVVPCCRTCNVAKASMSTQQFLDWVRRVYEKVVVRFRD